MDSLVIKIGILGSNSGNGHPFSFPAIINGYVREYLIAAGWAGIDSYLSKYPKGNSFTPPACVTHVWTPNMQESQNICNATFVQTVVNQPEDMIGRVDAVMILRDDWESHWRLSEPFLTAGLPVFIDKPLTMSPEELSVFSRYLNSGQLMSCSGLRFSPQLEGVKSCLVDANERSISIKAFVPKDLAKYGVHIIEMISSLNRIEGIRIKRISKSDDKSLLYEYTNNWGDDLSIVCLGESPEPVRMSVSDGGENTFQLTFTDNFIAFRSTIASFLSMVDTGIPPIPPAVSLKVVQTLISTSAFRQ